MATTKTKVPSESVKAILASLNPQRVVKVTEVTKNAKTRSTAVVESLKGKPVEGVKADKKSVDAAVKAGWLSLYGGQGGGSEDGVSTNITSYQITDEGKKARRAK